MEYAENMEKTIRILKVSKGSYFSALRMYQNRSVYPVIAFRRAVFNF